MTSLDTTGQAPNGPPSPDDVKIVIDEYRATADEMADLLEEIAAQLRDGNTSGFYPHWRLG